MLLSSALGLFLPMILAFIGAIYLNKIDKKEKKSKKSTKSC